MTDMPTTSRFALPLLAVAQAQKEVTHNEALTRLDALIHPAIEAGPLAVPPSDPANGQCWIVGAAPTGAWADQENALALWTAGGWRFVPPREGMSVTRLTDRVQLHFEAGAWIAPGVIEPPAGGSTIDSEARSAISTLILHLAAQGLLISG